MKRTFTITGVALLISASSFTLISQVARSYAAAASTDADASAPVEGSTFPGTLIGVQYELLFTDQILRWEGTGNSGIPGLFRGTQEAIPILGKYRSDDPQIIRKHEEWFEYLGIDWLLIDSANLLWMSPPWEQHRGPTGEYEKMIAVLFKTYSELEKEGKHPPKLVFGFGLWNGWPVKDGVKRLAGVFDYFEKNYLDKAEYRNLFLYYQGKPLVTIAYVPPDPCGERKALLAKTPLVEPRWTIRWLAAQLQSNHAQNCGMWSWMDGTIRQVVTYNSGIAEETVVTPSCFPFPNGWLDPRAVGRDHGSPYLESWQVALETHPKFIQIHQWNEFAGQAKGEGVDPGHDFYADEYSPELSDDIEPTKLSGCGYRGCGGWGYYYMNLTKALISLYRNKTPDITVMAISGPFQSAEIKEKQLRLKWTVVGKKPSSYSVQMDGKVLEEDLKGQEYLLDLSRSEPGKHQVRVVAKGAHTFFDLDPQQQTEESKKPLPVTSTIDITYSPALR